MADEERGKIFVKIFQKFLLLGLIFVAVLISAVAFVSVNAATAPTVVTYQGKVLVGGSAVTTSLSMKFVLYDALSGGNALYSLSGSTSSPSAVSITPSSGLFTVDLGGTGYNALDPEIFKNYGSVYLQITIGAETLTPRKQIGASPYAFNAKYLDGVAPSSTSPASQHIVMTDANGNLDLNSVTSAGLVVSGSSSLATTTISSSTISTINVGNLNIAGTVSGLSSTQLFDTSNLVRIIANNTFTGLNTFSSTTTLATTTVSYLSVSGGSLTGVTGNISMWTNNAGYLTSYIETDPIWLAASSSYAKLSLSNTFTGTNNFATTTQSAFRLGTSAASGYILTTDASGYGTWQAPGGGSLSGGATNTLSFWTSPTSLSNTSLFWDSTNGRLGVGTSTPAEKTHIAGGNILQTAYGNPTLKGNYNTFGSAKDVYVSGKYAYVADDSSLRIIDISNPASSTLVGTYSVNATAVYVSGKYAYTVGAEGLKIIDISNPTSPSLVGTYNISSVEIYVSGKYAYVLNGDLNIIDISNPASPSLLSTLDIFNAQGIYVSGKYAYVADGTAGLNIIDISNPASPSSTGVIGTLGSAFKVYVSGKYAYVAVFSEGLQIIDISNPASPSSVGSYDTAGSAWDVYVSGKYAYVADGTAGLNIIDISNPASPSLIGTLDTTDARNVYVSGKYAYAADGTAGLQIIDINGLETPAMYVGNIQSNDLTITENVDIGNNLSIRGGLNVGENGIMINGDFGMSGYVTNTLSFSTTTVFNNFVTGTASNAFILNATNLASADNSYLLSLRSDNIEKFSLSASGNLRIAGGITAITASTFATTTQTAFQLGTSATSGYVLTTDANGYGTWQAASSSGLSGGLANTLPYWVSSNTIGTTTLYWDNVNGRLGVGTTTPQYILDVNGGIAINGVRTLYMGGFLNSNTFVGANTGLNISSGSGNSFVGANAGLNVSTGNNNTYVGSDAGLYNTNGVNNVFVGVGAGREIGEGERNVFVGVSAGGSKSGGNMNTLVGWSTGQNNTTGYNNTMFGAYAGSSNTGHDNVFLGFQAGYNETGSNKLYVANSLTDFPLIYGEFDNQILRVNGNQQITGNLFVTGTLQAVSTSTFATTTASQLTVSNLSSGSVVFAGDGGLLSSTTTLYWDDVNGRLGIGTSVPQFALDVVGNINLPNTTSSLSGVISLGGAAFIHNYGATGGITNSFFGIGAGNFVLTTAHGNTAVGWSASSNLSTGTYNTTVGMSSLNSVSTGGLNTAVGWESGYRNDGSSNAFFGALAGRNNVSGSSNVFLGHKAGYNETGSGKLYITNDATSPTTSLIYGDFYNSTLTINGALDVTGTSTLTTTTVSNLIATGGSLSNMTGNISMWTNDSNYITSSIETDPIWLAASSSYAKLSAANTFTGQNIFSATTTLATTTASRLTVSELPSGSVVFAGADGLLSSSTTLNWDNVNGRLGVNKSGPSYNLDVSGSFRANPLGAGSGFMVESVGGYLVASLKDGNAIPKLTFGTGAGIATIEAQSNLGLNLDILGGSDKSFKVRTAGSGGVASDRFVITSYVDNAYAYFTNSNLGVGTTAPSEKLHVNGGNILHSASGNPTLKGAYDTTGTATGVYVSGKYAYVADYESGLQIIDVSNPVSSTLIGNYDTLGEANGVYVSGKYAYVADGASGLEVIDTSNHVSSTLTGNYNTPGYAYGIYISGKYAYVADNTSLQIVDISNPASPSFVGSYVTSTNLTGVYVSGKYAYVAAYAAGLLIIDVSNPASPVLKGQYVGAYFPNGVYVSGRYAYTSSGSGLQIIDVSNPAVPALVNAYTDSGSYGVYVSGKYAYSASSNGLRVINISNPASPTLAGAYNTAGAAVGVYVSGKYAYVVDQASGLQIVDINGMETPSLYAGNIQSNDLTITENTDIGNDLYVGGGLNVDGGIHSQGPLSSATTTVSKLTVSNLSSGSVVFAGAGGLISSTSSLYWDNTNGRLGVGTSTPQYALDINGNINLGTSGYLAIGGTRILSVSSTGYNTYLGALAGAANTSGNYNTFLGSSAGLSNTSGAENVFVGQGAGQSNNIGTSNVFIGTQAGNVNSSGGTNTFIGSYAGYANSTGSSNVFVGATAGQNNSSSGNTFLGVNAGNQNLSGSYNVFLGFEAGKNETGSNKLYIQNSLSATPLIYGDFSSNYLAFNNKLSINNGTSTPGYNLDVNGTMRVTGAVTLATTTASQLTVSNLSSGSVVFAGTGGLLSTNLGLHWDNTNSRLGIGTSTPSERVHIDGGNILHNASGDVTVKGSYSTSTSYSYDVYVSGKYAYVADWEMGLQIIDVSNPASPSLVGTYGSGALGVYVSGKYAYMVSSSALSIIDVSNPASPSLVGTYGNGGWSVYVSGKYAYVADGSALSIVDISNPTKPGLVSTFNFPGNSALGVYVSGKYAYVAADAAGLNIIDVSNPASPTSTGVFDTVQAKDVYVSGKYAYVADGTAGLNIIDVSNPASPTSTGTFDTLNAAGVYVSGKYAYVADGTAGLQILDISNPASPSLVDLLSTAAATGVYVSGKYAYVADLSGGLRIVDINGIETPSMYAGNVQSNDLTITENVDIGNNLSVRGGLNVGDSGIMINGDFGMSGNATNTLSFSTTTLFNTFVTGTATNAFIFNATNFASASNTHILSLRSNNISVFSVSSGGEVRALGNLYANSATVGTPGAPGDLAERVDIAVDDVVEPGDVMMVDPLSPDTYRRASGSYEQAVAGVISTNPTIVVGNGKTQYTGVMAMVGRVPVKASNENGPISRGDLLVSASLPGFAMKYDSTKDDGQKIVGIIGVALEPLSSSSTGKIMALIRTGWANSRFETINSLQNNIQQLASAQGVSLNSNPANLNVENQNGGIGYTGGNLNLQGNLVLNVKAISGLNDKWAIDVDGRFITRISTSDGDKEMYALQSPVVEFVFSSSSQLVAGEAVITFDQITQEIIDSEQSLKVNITLTSGEASGIYVSEKSASGFRVKELNNGHSNATFDWMVVAKRKMSNAGQAPVGAVAPSVPPTEVAPPPADIAPAAPPAETTPPPADTTPPPTETTPPPTEVAPPPADIAPAAPPTEATS